MRRTMRLLHLLGLVLFLGSIFVFAVTSSIPAIGDFTTLAVARRVISCGTRTVTLPGLGLLLWSGIALLVTRRSLLAEAWARIMVGAGVLVVANTLVFVLPAVRLATALAASSAEAGRLAQGYEAAYVRESVAGGVNIALALLAMVAGLWRFGARTQGHG